MIVTIDVAGLGSPNGAYTMMGRAKLTKPDEDGDMLWKCIAIGTTSPSLADVLLVLAIKPNGQLYVLGMQGDVKNGKVKKILPGGIDVDDVAEFWRMLAVRDS